MKIHYSSEIWNHRLQLLWISFAGIYLFYGDECKNHEWVSSFIVTLGSALTAALLAHILHTKDISSVRSTLLLAFASSMYLAQESSGKCEDDLAPFFCIIVGLCCAFLAWVENPKISRIFRHIFFAMLVLMVALSFSQLATTVLIKNLIEFSILKEQTFIIAPHTTGIVVGLVLGIAFGPQIVLKPYVKPNMLRIFFTISTLIIFSLVVGGRVVQFRIDDTAYLSGSGYAYVAWYASTYIFICVAILYKLVICNKNKKGHSWAIYLMANSLALSLSLGAGNFIFFALNGYSGFPITQSIAAEAISAATLSLTLLISCYFIRKVSFLIYVDTVTHKNSKDSGGVNTTGI